jgi:hypothetical protein
MGVIKFLLSKVPSDWWRKMIQIYLVSTCSFFLLNIAMDMNFIERYTYLLSKCYITQFVALQVIVTLLFYKVLDFLLRLLFHKVVKKKIIKINNQINEIPRMVYLKSLTEIKNVAATFVMGFPVELGYITRTELNEITSTETNTITDIEKKEALNEIIIVLNKWACILVHTIVTMLVVYKYDKTTMISILIV